MCHFGLAEMHIRVEEKKDVSLVFKVLRSCITLISKNGTNVQDAINLILSRNSNSFILVVDIIPNKYCILLEHILFSAKTNYDYIIISYWRSIRHIKCYNGLIQYCWPNLELKPLSRILLLIDDIDDTLDGYPLLRNIRSALPHGVTVSVVAVCYKKLSKSKDFSWDHCFDITGFEMNHSAKGIDVILIEYLGRYKITYEELFNDSIILSLAAQLETVKLPNTLTELVYRLSLKIFQNDEKGPVLFDLVSIECLIAHLREHTVGRFVDVSYIRDRLLSDNSEPLKHCMSNRFFNNAAVKDMMAARGIQLLPIRWQIVILTSCAVHDTVYSFYGGLMSPDLCVSSFDKLMFVLPDIFEGMLIHNQNKIAECLLCAMQCLYQVQEPNLCLKFLEKCADYFKTGVEFANQDITYYIIAVLSSFIQMSSNFSSWTITVPSKKFVSFFGACNVQEGKVMSLKLTDHSRITKKKGGAESSNMVQRISSYAASEILLKFLQFISPVPVVCSSKNPGYTSFVSCQCLKEVVLSGIHFDPIIPTHWVSADAKYSKQLNSSHANHTQVHGPELIEYVILLAPLPCSIRCTLPTNDVIIVQVDNQWIDTPEGAVMEAAKSSSDFCSAEMEARMLETDKSDPVFPNYILAKILNDK